MTPIEGAFYPYDEEGDIVDIKKGATTTHDFTVVPYLEVEWVNEPHLMAEDNNRIEATIKFTRNANPKDAEGEDTRPAVSEIYLFVSSNQYVGNGNCYDDIISTGMPPNAGKVTTPLFLQENREITLRTSREVKYTNTRYYVRVGVRCNDQYQKYNYTTIVTVDVP